MATSRTGAPEEPFLTRYSSMAEARIEFDFQSAEGNTHYVCRLYSSDLSRPYDIEQYDIINKDQAIRSRDFTTDTNYKSNVQFIAHTDDISTMDQLRCMLGEARLELRDNCAGFIDARSEFYDYAVPGRRTKVLQHHANPSAYVIISKPDSFSKEMHIGMIQLDERRHENTIKRQVVVELSKPTGNIVKALLLMYAIKLAYTVYKLHEVSGDSPAPLTLTHFQPVERQSNRGSPNCKLHKPKTQYQPASCLNPQTPVGASTLRLTAASEQYDECDYLSAFNNYVKETR